MVLNVAEIWVSGLAPQKDDPVTGEQSLGNSLVAPMLVAPLLVAPMLVAPILPHSQKLWHP